MKAVVMGSGGWGTALSQVLCDNGHDTWLWSHNAAKAAEMQKTRENPLLKGVILPETLQDHTLEQGIFPGQGCDPAGDAADHQ